MSRQAWFENELSNSLKIVKSSALATEYIPYETMQLNKQRRRASLPDAYSREFVRQLDEQDSKTRCEDCLVRAQLLIEAETLILSLIEQKEDLQFRLTTDGALEEANCLIDRLHEQLRSEEDGRTSDRAVHLKELHSLREQYADIKNEAIAEQTLRLNAIIDSYRKENEQLKISILERDEELLRLKQESLAEASAKADACTSKDIQRLENVELEVQQLSESMDSLEREQREIKTQLQEGRNPRRRHQ